MSEKRREQEEQIIDSLCKKGYTFCNFKKTDLLYNAERDGDENLLARIIAEGHLLKTIDFLSKSGEKIELSDYFLGASPEKTAFYMLVKAEKLEVVAREMEKNGTAINKEVVFGKGKNQTAIIDAAINEEKLPLIDSVLNKKSEAIKVEDLVSKDNFDKKSCLERAADYSQLDYLCRYFKEKGEPIAPQILFEEKDGNPSAYEVFYNKVPDIALKMLDDNFKPSFANLVDEKGNKKSLFEKMLKPDGIKYLLEAVEGKNVFVSYEKAIAGFFSNPLCHAIKAKSFKALAKNIEDGGEHFKNKDFRTAVGLTGKALFLTALECGEMSDIQAHLKKHNEPVFSLKDIDISMPDLTKPAFFEKVLGVPDFSNKPRDLKEFWEKLPERTKTKKHKEIYQLVLKKSITTSIALSNFKERN